LLHSEPDLALRIVRDIFNADFESLIVSGDDVGAQLEEYLTDNAPSLAERLSRWTKAEDVFTEFRVDEQLAKALDRKVYLPSGGSLVIDRTEAMTVVDVNTGRFTGQGGNLEETVTRNNLEAAEEVVRQIRLRDTGGIIVIDFIDMVLESNRDLVLRRLVESLGRDRTKHQVAEVTSLGLVQMTRKRIGQGLLETFGETCDCCAGRGMRIQSDPVDRGNERPRRPVRPPGSHDPVEAARSHPEKSEDEDGDSDVTVVAAEPGAQTSGTEGTADLAGSLSDDAEDDADTATLAEDVDELDLEKDR
jgi:ribonuclease E